VKSNKKHSLATFFGTTIETSKKSESVLKPDRGKIRK